MMTMAEHYITRDEIEAARRLSKRVHLLQSTEERLRFIDNRMNELNLLRSGG